jgi:cytochrome c5
MVPESLPPGIAPEKLPEPNSLGAKHLQKYCTQCHDLFSPRMHSAEKWISVFQRMSWHMQMMPRGRKMGAMIKIEAPSPQEGAELLTYLKRHSLLAADQSKLEHLDSPSGIAFLQTCAQCHALPAPIQHTTQEWPSITTRMKQNMQIMHKPLMQPKEEALIVQFLQLSANQ